MRQYRCHRKSSLAHNRSKSQREKWVFKEDLNISSDSACLKCNGKLFQSLDLGTSNSCWLEDLRALTGLWTCSSSPRYWGARPLKILKTNNRTLKCILKWMGSQCKEARTGVMWSHFLVPVKRRAAVFCTSCRWRREHWSKPTYKGLQ